MPYSKYYKILNIPVGSSKQEIKRAFRRKAMLTHPDRNPNPNAKKQFLEVNTAYEILTGQRSLPQQRFKPASPGANRPSKTQNHSAKNEQAKAREERREKLKEARRKKEEAYRNSPQFKKDLAIGIILDQIGYIVAAIVLSTVPFILIADPIVGIVIAIIAICLTYPLWYRAIFTPHQTINLKHFRLALKYIYANTHFRYYLFATINLTAILVFICNTFVSFSLVVSLMAIPSFILLIKQKALDKTVTRKQWFHASSLGPLLVNLFFVLNFTFSHSTTDEYYKVSPYYNRGSSFFMQFAQHEYENYPSIRFFMTSRNNFDSYVWLKTETGLFGIRVLKDYDFVHSPGEKTSID